MSDNMSDDGSTGSRDEVEVGYSHYVFPRGERFPIRCYLPDYEHSGELSGNRNRSSQEQNLHYYPEQAQQISYEEIARGCKLAIEGTTDVSSSANYTSSSSPSETTCYISYTPKTARSCRQCSCLPKHTEREILTDRSS
jgi:hypothetical protein